MSTTSKTTTYRRPATEEARERYRAYQRQYRRTHKDKVRQWQRNFYLRQAEKLMAEAEGVNGNVD